MGIVGETVLTQKIMTPKMVEQLGLNRVCAKCRPRELVGGKAKLKGLMCPVCGNHYDEFGNHNSIRAYKWLYATFQQAGYPLNDLHVESLYMMARLKVANNEAPYLETIDFALNQLRGGAKLPE